MVTLTLRLPDCPDTQNSFEKSGKNSFAQIKISEAVYVLILGYTV